MMFRVFPPCFVLTLLAVLIAYSPVSAQKIHRNGFSGKEAFWVQGDANIHYEVKDQRISDDHARNATTSEYIKIAANPAPGTSDREFVHFYYECPPAPLNKDLFARVYVKAYRAGAQLKARVVFPKEKDPRNPDSPLTTLLLGDEYKNIRQWQSLSFGDFSEILQKQMPILTAKIGRTINTTGAYIDQMVLNVYTGPGNSEIWIDDLEIGPVLPKPEGVSPRNGRPTSLSQAKTPTVEFSNGDILIDGKPFLMRAIRHTSTPLWALEVARFNTIWFPGQVDPETYEDAIRAKFFIVPSLPLPAADWDPSRPTSNDQALLDQDAEIVANHLRQFLSGDSVLMWDLGAGRTTEQIRRIARVSETIKRFDSRRPRAIDLWDGYNAYSNYVDAVGAHRWPLFTSLSYQQYKDWLTQRRSLTAPGKLSWTWIQTHLPEWYLALTTGTANTTVFPDPIGPHPEQIRTLTYLALAAGYRGLGFWSDQFLADSHHGRDRLLEIAMLNAELELLEPVLLSANQPAKWIPTTHPSVQAAVISSAKDTLVLPIWLGKDGQYCPEQATLSSLTMTVPLVPDGALAWRISAGDIQQIKDVKRVPAGTQFKISEFDTAEAIVFTTDLSPNGKVVRWQDNIKNKLSRTASLWARTQAVVQYNKTLVVHNSILAKGGPVVPEAGQLFAQSRDAIRRASEFTDNNQADLAYREARRALRPLRVLMREDWRLATSSLDLPTASPYAMSFFTLPKHWELTEQMRNSRPGGNSLLHGGFELSERLADEGAAVSSLPQWIARKALLDAVSAEASIVNSDSIGIADEDPGYTNPVPFRNAFSGRPVYTENDEIRAKPKPNLGNHTLRLAISAKKDEDGKLLEQPRALERSFLAVDSPPAEFTPGTWVRISFWAKVPAGVKASADGAIIYDSVGGEPLSVRLDYVPRWEQYHIYRPVPESGKINVTFALTGFGVAFFDDVKIEPMTRFNNPANYTSGNAAPPKPRSNQEKEELLPYPQGSEKLPLPRNSSNSVLPPKR